MNRNKEFPPRLFKYRSFSDLTLEMLVTDQVYFADPSTFNDPLDTKPHLSADISSVELEQILTKLVEQRENAEMTAAASRIKYSGPKTIDHISRHSRRRAERLISEIRYESENPMYDEYELDDPFHQILSSRVQEELLRRYDRGVFSLAERDDCPLMWSHYGDQHRGICIGFSLRNDESSLVYQMKYDGSRLVNASRVSAMLKGDHAAQQEVDQAVLANKARDWQYEKEWRVIGERGLQDSGLELEEIVFGMRCKSSVIHSVVKALEGRGRPVKFYQIRQKLGDFSLEKHHLDNEAICELPRRRISAIEAFGPAPDIETK